VSDWTQVVVDEIQQGYGDATQTELDVRVARAIIDRLLSMGWADPESVRALVAGAGGRIEVARRVMADPPAELFAHDDPATLARVFEVR
jgi:hypothetical protein